MRNSKVILSLFNSIVSNDDCSDTSIERQSFKKQKCSYSSGSHSFTHCTWNNNGLSSDGGAIHLLSTSPQPSVSLIIDQCTFQHCYEANPVDGGAVYVSYIGSVSISDSSFYDCKCGTGTTLAEGAGVCILYISVKPLLLRCSFISCVSPDDGGGCGIYYCDSSLLYTVDSCCFIKCIGKDSDGQGGGVLFYRNTGNQACTNCLFSELEAYYGGAFYSYIPNYVENSYPVKFCFFNKNSDLASGYGTDVCFDELYPNNNTVLFQQCFSTSDSKRVGYHYSIWSSTDVDWFPSGTLSYMNAQEETLF